MKLTILLDTAEDAGREETSRLLRALADALSSRPRSAGEAPSPEPGAVPEAHGRQDREPESGLSALEMRARSLLLSSLTCGPGEIMNLPGSALRDLARILCCQVPPLELAYNVADAERRLSALPIRREAVPEMRKALGSVYACAMRRSRNKKQETNQ